MKRRTRNWWMTGIAVVVMGAIFFIAFSAAQPVTQKETVTLEEIYALLVTEDGRNRLDVIEEWLVDLDEEVDLIYLQAKEMMEEAGWQFEQQEWTLDDIKFLLDAIEDKIDAIKTKVEA